MLLTVLMQFFGNNLKAAWVTLIELLPALIFFNEIRVRVSLRRELRLSQLIVAASLIPCLMGVIQVIHVGHFVLNANILGLDVPFVSGGYPEGRANSILPHANSFAFYLALVWPLLLEKLLTTSQSTLPNRPLLTLFGSLSLICLVSTGSRNGMIATLIVSAITLVVNRRQLHTQNLLSLLILGITVLAATHLPTATSTASRLTAELSPVMADSGHNRLNNWRLALAMIQQRPWVGYGPGSFNVLFERYYHVTVHHPHNLWLMLAAEQGIPAAIMITGTVIGGVIYGIRKRYGRLILGLKDPFVVSSIGLFILCLFDVPFYKWQVSFLAMVILAMAARLPEDPPPAPVPASAETGA